MISVVAVAFAVEPTVVVPLAVTMVPVEPLGLVRTSQSCFDVVIVFPLVAVGVDGLLAFVGVGLFGQLELSSKVFFCPLDTVLRCWVSFDLVSLIDRFSALKVVFKDLLGGRIRVLNLGESGRWVNGIALRLDKIFGSLLDFVRNHVSLIVKEFSVLKVSLDERAPELDGL